ncbi:Hypothetical protein R9X50_00568800 [Acrodontium crateriforme]|uniref:SCA7 domain-containing protein n=1 Tax=Acrodontium crateriforme TaxID=150365 RepID=A0AAQ3RBP9_9PEZI|nr:Hypothetical protein R9X50_00568800 [Acrodontium crateriforme]
MAPNGTASRKTPTAPKAAKSGESISIDILFADYDEKKKASLKENIKSIIPTIKKPGSWDSEVSGHIKSKTREEDSKSHVNKIPSPLVKSFPNGKIMADKPNLLKCAHCKRPVLKHAMPGHIGRCLNKKQEKQRKKKEAKDARDAAARKAQGDSDEDDNDAKKSTKGGLTASKKRKAADEDEIGPSKKKKKKEDSKAKAARPKAPVDVEKQCGVELPQGGQCARSLTCKSHSMGAKRAVPGRSAPYDKLLLEYQRKNQAKLQKAAFDANAPNPDDDALPSGPVDSEEEKDAVMGAIARSWGGQPIYQSSCVPLWRKYEHNRIKSMLSSAMGGGRGGGGLFGTGQVSGGGFFGSAPVVDDHGVVHARKGSVVPGARSMMPSSRKPSIASTAGA